MSKSCLLLSLFICFFSFSCDNKVVYNQFQHIENGSWEKEKEISFSFEIEDISIPYNLTLQLRNNNLYPFRNLELSYQELQPDTPLKTDTITIQLADKYGNWLGNGISLFEREYPIYSGYYFRHTGTYTFYFRHLMYKDPLPGIQDIGLKVNRVSLP